MAQHFQPTCRLNAIAAIGLACLVVAVYSPIVGFEFVDLDVEQQIVENPHIRGFSAENVKHILTSRCLTSYYPVRTLTFALDYQIWGLNPTGFKLTNGLIHLTNVLLVFWLALRLFRHPAGAGSTARAGWELSAATFSAAVFAVHPVVVEPVAWVAGREELLMTLGALGCIHFHIAARRLGAIGGRVGWMLTCYAGAACCCAAACLSSALGAAIPLLITAFEILTLPRPTVARILGSTAALWAIGIVTFVVKKACEFLSAEQAADVFCLPRVWLVFEVYWLNLKTLVWPVNLAISHDWSMPGSFLERDVILGIVAVGASCAVLWRVRRKKLILFGLVWFGMALGPSAQIMPHHIDRADRFLYLPLVGLVIAVALAVRARGAAWNASMKAAAIAVGMCGLAALAMASSFQLRCWKDDVAMWENCVRLDPNNAQLRCGYADSLDCIGRFHEAADQYETSLRLAPGYSKTMVRYARLLATCEDRGLRDYDRALRLAQRAYQKNPLFSRTLALVWAGYADALVEEGDFARAVEGYRRSIDLDPARQSTLLGLAKLRATCVDTGLRDPEEAVRLAERAGQSAEPLGPEGLGILAAAYAAAGRLDDAEATARRALALAHASGDAASAARLRKQLAAYQDQAPRRGTP